VQFNTGLYEHELDHVFTGRYNGPVAPDAAEVHAYRWISWANLADEVKQSPEQFTFWLRTILEKQLIGDWL
jgi:isopentenyl-diphosphate delta-isomerase